MKKTHLLISLILLYFFQFNGIAQENKPSTKNKRNQSLYLGGTPFLIITQATLGMDFKKNQWEHSVYLKTGILGDIFNYSINADIGWVPFSKKTSSQTYYQVKIPLTISYKNLFEWYQEEYHTNHNLTLYLLGTGLEGRVDYRNRLSILTRIGAGYGLRYIDAGNFRFSEHTFERLRYFPNFDLHFLYRF